jgi:hypothetical protein
MGSGGRRATHDLFLDKNGPGTHHRAGAIGSPPQGRVVLGSEVQLGRDAAPFPLRKGISLIAQGSITPGERARLVPVKISADIRATPPTDFADKSRPEIREPKIIRPLINYGRRQRDVMAAPVIGAIDQDAANAGFAHLAEGDFLGPGHAP